MVLAGAKGREDTDVEHWEPPEFGCTTTLETG